ncbi:hypothetical protein NQ314_000434, partial [Rhamnusium bicolor]
AAKYNHGIRRQYELGKWFRIRYGSFLPETYSPNDIYVRSSDKDRTLMSAEANLAGLYPPKKSQIWNQKLSWRPIPIHTVREEEDKVIAMKKECPKYEIWYDQLLNSKFFENINEQNKNLYKYLSENTGWNITTVREIETLYSLFSIERESNLTLPTWTQGIFPEKLEFLAALSHASFSFTKQLARLISGPFFDYLFSHFDNITNNSSTKKFLMLSGHDNTIVNILSAMGLYDYKCPEFASTIIWELRQNENDSYINLFYKNKVTLTKLKLFGCDMNCNYSRFKHILETVTVNEKNWNKECLV